MKQEFSDYLNAIGCPQSMVERVEYLIGFVQNLYGLEATDIFVGTNQNEENVDYTSLCLFSENDVVECKSFMSTIDVDIVKFKENISYFYMKYNSVDYSGVNEGAPNTLRVKCLIPNSEVSFLLVAFRENTKYLDSLTKKVIIPNIIK